MTTFQRILFILLLVAVAALGVYKGWFGNGLTKHSAFEFDRPMIISMEKMEWEFGKPEKDTLTYIFSISDLVLKANNTLSFSMVVPKAPVVIESILGSQLGKLVFQIPYQSLSTPETVEVDGIVMSSFNPFEPINLLFIYEYDEGIKIRHHITFEIN